MGFAETLTAAEVADPYQMVADLSLERHVADLDAYGYTVVPPDQVGMQDLIEPLKNRIKEVAQSRSGIQLDVHDPAQWTINGQGGFHAHRLLGEGRIFEQALMNPVVLTLITYLLGNSCVLSSMSSTLKGPGGDRLDLHTDNVMIPSPFPAFSQTANATLTLTDYSPENGSIHFWPGSHRLCRHPTPEECENTTMFVPVTTPAGSLIVWHGNSWHGAVPRQQPDYRMNLIMYFCRMYLVRQENIPALVTDEMRERNSDRFRLLVGDHVPYPLEGPNAHERMFFANRAGKLQTG